MQFCREPNCPGIAKTGLFCEQHQTSTTLSLRGRHPNERWYYRKEWRGRWGVRRFKIRRDPICEYVEENGMKCAAHATDVHHIRWVMEGKRRLDLIHRGSRHAREPHTEPDVALPISP